MTIIKRTCLFFIFRDAGWQNYHKFECPIVEATSMFKEEILLALR